MKQTVEEAAIESCVIDRSIYNDEYQPYYLDGFKDGAEWQAKQSPWISVKERLPEEGQPVLIRLKDGVIRLACYDIEEIAIYTSGMTITPMKHSDLGMLLIGEKSRLSMKY